MSGHSKWSQIKRQKGAQDQKRGALFTKLGNAITIAAREGGKDYTANFKLRLAIDKAKSANMPKDNIERAIKRGTGELKASKLYELSYEAFGPGGTGLIIKVLTDNKNRTASEVKHLLTKYHGHLGSPGSVNWQFQELGIVRLNKENLDVGNISLQAIDLGAEDVIEELDSILIKTKKQDLQKVKEGLEKQGVSIDYAEVELIPETQVEVDDKTKEQLKKLFDDLDESLDVSGYYHNIDIK